MNVLVNCELLLKFEVDRSKSHFSHLVSNAFITMEDAFSVYIPYCEGYANAIDHLTNLREVKCFIFPLYYACLILVNLYFNCN